MKIIASPSPNFSERKAGTKINSIVLHYTGMLSCKEAIDRMCDPRSEVSTHYCIDEDGTIYRLVEDDKKAWHSGKSHWRGTENLNDTSIGIEIVNPGHEHGYCEFTAPQIDTLIKLCKILMAKNPGIDQRNIVAHSDIAPTRKEDPGELFPWELLYDEGIGIYHTINYDENFHYREPYIIDGEEGKNIGEIQRKLAAIGYKIQRSTLFDEDTKKVVAAFYRRFIPERILMCKNNQYPEDIRWDSLSDIVLNDLFEKFNY